MCVLTVADQFLLDGNHANSFLVQKRRADCDYINQYAETMREEKYGVFRYKVDVHEECCDEGCDKEEMNENMHPTGVSDTVSVRTNIHDMLYCTFIHFSHYCD